MPRGSHVPRNDYPPIRMVRMTGEVYAEVIETAECGGVNLRMYGVAKAVANCLKRSWQDRSGRNCGCAEGGASPALCRGR